MFKGKHFLGERIRLQFAFCFRSRCPLLIRRRRFVFTDKEKKCVTFILRVDHFVVANFKNEHKSSQKSFSIVFATDKILD